MHICEEGIKLLLYCKQTVSPLQQKLINGVKGNNQYLLREL